MVLTYFEQVVHNLSQFWKHDLYFVWFCRNSIIQVKYYKNLVVYLLDSKLFMLT